MRGWIFKYLEWNGLFENPLKNWRIRGTRRDGSLRGMNQCKQVVTPTLE